MMSKEFETELMVKTRLIDEALVMLAQVAKTKEDKKEIGGFEMYVCEELQPFMDVEITYVENDG